LELSEKMFYNIIPYAFGGLFLGGPEPATGIFGSGISGNT